MAKRKTHEKFIEEMRVANQNIEIISKYINDRTKIECRCKICGNEWCAIPHNLLRREGCSNCAKNKKKTHEEFIEELSKLNKNIKILGEYMGAKTPIECECLIDGYRWFATPDMLLGHTGCPKCHNVARRDTASFVCEMKEINPNIKILGEYINLKTKTKCVCLVCNNEWDTTPANLLNRSGCPKCAVKKVAGIRRKEHDEFVREMKNINSNIKITNKYINNRTKVECECLICDCVWSSTPSNLLKGRGCTECAQKSREISRRKTHEAFIEDMKIANPNIEIISKYVNSKTNISCRCSICGSLWSAKPANLLSGTGCPKCTRSKSEDKIECFLKSNNIGYVLQKKFDDLLGLGGRKLSYDFYIPANNLLVECQGLQHKKPVDYFGGDKSFAIQQEHDKRKREYARKHNIDLLEVWYYDYGNIEQIMSEKLHINNTEKSA